MTRYAVRAADPGDLAAIRVLREGWAREHGVDPSADPGFADRLDGWWQRQAAARHTWVAWAERTPVGMAAVVRFERMPAPGRPDGAWGYVSQLWVDPH